MCRLVVFALLFLLFLQANTTAQRSKGVVSISADETTLIPRCQYPAPPCEVPASKDFIVDLQVRVDEKLPSSQLRYSVDYGKILGEGERVQWDLSGQLPGTYKVSVVQFTKGKQAGELKTAIVTIENNLCICDCICPVINLLAPEKPVKNGSIQYYTASVNGGVDVSYNWTVENGEIVSGQGTPELKVRVKRSNPRQEITVTFELGGLIPACGCPTKETASAPIVD